MCLNVNIQKNCSGICKLGFNLTGVPRSPCPSRTLTHNQQKHVLQRTPSLDTQIHASQTEDFLTGRRLTDSETVLEAAKLVGQEVKPDSHPQDATPAYRTSLAQSLLYKVGPRVFLLLFLRYR